MMIPGSNLLNIALTVIAKQTITYYRYIDRIQNDIGQDVTQYAPAVEIVGSFQPVPRSLYQVYGLDFQKSYFTFYTSNNVKDIARNISGSQIAFQGRRYQCESNNDWYGEDGWKGILCVDIGADPGEQALFGFNEEPEINSYENFGNGNFIEPGGA